MWIKEDKNGNKQVWYSEYEYKQLEKENAELKAENVRLKNRMQTLDEEDITVEITEDEFEEYKQLKAENKRLKSCLQEIKEIAETPKPFIDNLEIKSATEVGYDYAAICNELEKRLHKVLELITKAESEG